MMLIIGYGSPLRGDDGVGPYIAQQLERQIQREDVEIVICHQLTPELVEPVSRADLVIFLDARRGKLPGQIISEPVVPLPPSSAFTHQLNPAGLLANARDLYHKYPDAMLITVTGANFDFSETLSPHVQAVAPRLVEVLASRLQSAEA